MTLLGGAITVKGVTFLLFCVFAIAILGYALGRITIKGVNLGTAGVFIVALLFGCFFFEPLKAQLMVTGDSGETVSYVDSALKVVESLGLILFVTSVGFIAGPKFFGNMKKNFKSYVLLGILIILAGGISAIGCIYLGRALGETNHVEFTAMIVGLLSGSLTSTPAFSAAKDTVAAEYVNSGMFSSIYFANSLIRFFICNNEPIITNILTIPVKIIKYFIALFTPSADIAGYDSNLVIEYHSFLKKLIFVNFCFSSITNSFYKYLDFIGNLLALNIVSNYITIYKHWTYFKSHLIIYFYRFICNINTYMKHS